MDNIVKEEIVEWILRHKNRELLEALRQIKEASEANNWFDDLNEDEKESLQKGQRDHQEGNVMNSTQFWDKHAWWSSRNLVFWNRLKSLIDQKLPLK